MKNFKFTGFTKNWLGTELHQIEATANFNGIKKGAVGGFIEKEENLSSDAWVSGNAQVYGDARVYGGAQVYGDAGVYGGAQVYGDAWVTFDVTQTKYIVLGQFGEHHRYVTATQSTVRCGCFEGTLESFKGAVVEKYGKDFGSYADCVKMLEVFMA